MIIKKLDISSHVWRIMVLILNDWNVFLKVFSRFSDPFAKRNATDALLSLTQGKAQSVLNYWTKFSDPDSARPLFEKDLDMKYVIAW
jgi:hypothetical protein